MSKVERYAVGLDIGTTKICCVVGEIKDDGRVHIVGLGEALSRGLRKGVVVNLDATVDAIKSALEEAELMAGVDVESATVGIAGGHIRSFNSRGVVHVNSKDRTVSQEDLRRVMEAARAVSIPQDREILHVLSQEFVLDDQAGIEFIRLIRRETPYLPVLMQSSEEQHKESAAELRASFLNKGSRSLLHDLRSFLLGNLGFQL